MITLFRMIRLWQLKTKWELAIWQLINKQAMEIIKNPEEIKNKIIAEIAKLIHENKELNKDSKGVFDSENQKINS